MTTAWPVVMGILLVPVEVAVTSCPSLIVVKIVVNSWSEVETRALVNIMLVVLGGEDARLLLAGGAALERGDEGWLFPPLDGAGVDCGGSDLGGFELGAWDDAGGGVDTGGGATDDGGRADEEGGGVGVLPVPLACRFSP